MHGELGCPATLPQILQDSQQVTHHADFGRSLHKPALKSQPVQCTTTLPPHNDCRSPFKEPGRAGIKWRSKALIAPNSAKCECPMVAYGDMPRHLQPRFACTLLNGLLQHPRLTQRIDLLGTQVEVSAQHLLGVFAEQRGGIAVGHRRLGQAQRAGDLRRAAAQAVGQVEA